MRQMEAKTFSAPQQKIIDRMKDGWSLAYEPYRSRAWLQLGGIGMSGPVENVHINTFNALFRSGAISKKQRTGTEYVLVSSIDVITPTLEALNDTRN